MIRIWTLENKRNENYDYDRNSNRKIITENGKNRSYTYYKNDKNGNTAHVMFDGKWYYTYDDNGNRTAKGYKQKSDNDKVVIDETRENWKYTWDYHNRLVKVQQFNAPDNAQNVKVEYTYDVMNRRIERASYISGTSVKTQYAYGRNGAMTYQKKTAGTSVTSRTFIYLNNQMVGFMDKTDNKESLRYTVTDIQGSVTEVYDKDNNLLWKSGYTAFGIKAGETTKLLDFDGLYTGCDYDAETGLTYHWNRWRSENGDSWLSEDPARDGINWYGYAGQNPVTYTDVDGYSTTRDDWAYQQRMEAKDSETYAKTFETERQAAVDNQGISNVEYNRYNQDGTPKNPEYEDTQNKLNYFVHVFENEQNKIINKPFKQKVIERKYGYGNFLCLITSILNAYVSDGVVTQRFMDREFGDIIRNNLKTNGCLINLTKYSHQIASALGLDYFYDYAKKSGRNDPLYLSETAFRLSDYKYGIGRFMKPNNYYGTILRNSYMELDLLSPFKDSMTSIDHYGTYRNDPFNDYFNPGVANGIGNYVLYDIIPLVSKKI